jgi:general secretion pathway protein J
MTRNQTAENRNKRQATSGRKPRGGFTLVELMLAILIFGLVVTTVLVSFNAVFSSTEALEINSTIYEMAKNCLKRMTVDLESIYVAQPPIYKPPEFDETPNDFRFVGISGDQSGTGFAQLRFTSRAHARFEKSYRKGIAEIVYYVQRKEDGNNVLKRADNLYPYPDFEEKGADPTLCEHVKSLAFSYVDAEGSDNDVWDSESDEYKYATPKAVAIKLEIEIKESTHIFETLVYLPIYRQDMP